MSADLFRRATTKGNPMNNDTAETPDWKRNVLAALTNEHPDSLTPDQVEDPDRWQLAFATLMAARGQEQPLYLAELVQRVDSIERSNHSLYKTLETISSMREDRKQEEERLRRMFRQFLRAEGVVGGSGGRK